MSDGRRWPGSSPQDFFVASFALVRHPVDRLRAVYVFQRQVEGAIPEGTSFGEWLEDIAERREEDAYAFDGALRPMIDLVPDAAEVFRVENGLEGLAGRLDSLGGAPAPALSVVVPPDPDSVPSAIDLEWIAELYADDFARFGYEVEGVAARRRGLAGILRRQR